MSIFYSLPVYSLAFYSTYPRWVISRPRRTPPSFILSLINSVILFLHALTVRYAAFCHKIYYVRKLYEILNLKRHPNRITGSRVTAILLNGWILSIGGVAQERVCTAGLFYPWLGWFGWINKILNRHWSQALLNATRNQTIQKNCHTFWTSGATLISFEI